MAGPSWLVDSNRIATKIKSASGACDPKNVVWKSNPTKSCPNCHHVVDNSDVNQAWPGLPRGVKFDPTDHEIVLHLLAKCGVVDFRPHPFIDEFIPTVDEHDGICYTHPEKLPGVKRDGTVSHFFHRAIKAYSTGTRKRRKIHTDDSGDFRWHKTGRTKPVTVDGVQRGSKKIMVLYVGPGPAKGGKPEKTNWVMHQYHLGTGEDEKEGEYVVSKIFYQQPKPSGRDEEIVIEETEFPAAKVDPVTPKSVTPEPPRAERRVFDVGPERDVVVPYVEPTLHETVPIDKADSENAPKKLDLENASEAHVAAEIHVSDQQENNENNDNHGMEESKWWDSESQHLLDSQQLVEGLSLCDELLQSQSPQRGDGTENRERDGKPRLADYARLGSEDLKKDLEECQHLVLDPANLELDTPPEFRLSQLEFGSQESFLAWGGCR